MAAGQSNALGWSGLGSFCCGLALIVSATVLNLAHDRMSPREVEALPLFLSDLYDMAGKLGVTLLLVGTGLSLILLGLALRCDTLLFSRAPVRTEPEPEGVYFYTADDQPESAVGPNGGLVLQTRKYLHPKRSKTGSTAGNAARPGDR
jgi:hypothetical protein